MYNKIHCTSNDIQTPSGRTCSEGWHDKCQSLNILMILKDNGYIKADTSMSSNSSFFLRLMLDSSSLSSSERSSGTVEKQMWH